jgi:hypothetical protein
MERVTSVKALDGYKLEVTFSDGVCGTVSMESRLFGPVFEPLKDTSLFKQASVDEFGAVTWPTGADLAPDALYRVIQAGAHAA